MPHIAPLPWAITSLLFWLAALLLMSAVWWQQVPTFKSLVTPKPLTPQPPWHWK